MQFAIGMSLISPPLVNGKLKKTFELLLIRPPSPSPWNPHPAHNAEIQTRNKTTLIHKSAQ